MKIITVSMLLYLCTGTKRKNLNIKEIQNINSNVLNFDKTNSNPTFNACCLNKSAKFGNFLDDFEELLSEIDIKSKLPKLTCEEVAECLSEVESESHQSTLRVNDPKRTCKIISEISSVVHPISLETQTNQMTLNMLQDNKQMKKNVSIENSTYMKLVSEIKNLTWVNDELKTKKRLATNENTLFYLIVSSLKAYIDGYIIYNMHESYRKPHIKRLDLIEESFLLFDNHKIDKDELKLKNDVLKKKELMLKFETFISQFKEGLQFDSEFCKTFFLKYDSDIFYSIHSFELRKRLNCLSYIQKRLFFYFELMSLYKYVYDIPEILTLGCLFSEHSFYKICNVMQMINLYVHKIDDAKTRRNFVLCMIYVAFEYYYGRLFNIFLIPNYRFLCDKEFHDLNFFIWEFSCYRRRDMKLRRHLTEQSIEYDKKYFKLVFLIFLYQHTIFIKFFKVKGEALILFLKFVNKVIISEKCVACLFKEYLEITQSNI